MHCILHWSLHCSLHCSALVCSTGAASARTNNWNWLRVWEDGRRDLALITTNSNQPTPPTFPKLGLKILLFLDFSSQTRPSSAHLVSNPWLWYCPRGACQGPNFRGDSNLDFGRGGQSEELTRSPHSKKLETDKQRLDQEKNQRAKKKKEKNKRAFRCGPAQAFLSPMADKLQLSLPRHCRLFAKLL